MGWNMMRGDGIEGDEERWIRTSLVEMG